MAGSPSVRAALAVLGLEPDADRDAVTGAYRRLAKAHHPDVSTASDAAERFAAIAAAYRQALAATPVRVDAEPPRWTVRPQPFPRPTHFEGPVIVAGPVHIEPPGGELRWI